MIRVSFANHEFIFKDGDVLGSGGTVDPAFFARFEGIRSRHVVFSETPTESFFLIPEEVDSIVRLDGVRIAHGVQQKITGRHSLILNEAGMLIEWSAENDLLGPNNETADEPEFGVNQGALGTDLRLLELIVENIDDLIAVIDSRGRRVWNNAAYARVLGYSVDSLAGSNSLIEVHPDDLAKVQKAIIFTSNPRGGFCRRAMFAASSWSLSLAIFPSEKNSRSDRPFCTSNRTVRCRRFSPARK
jgi:PAS domain-containing protein